MTFVNAGPSPVSLGVVAILSFGGLVVSAFASGYHLASHTGEAALGASRAVVAGTTSAGSEATAAAFAPIPGRVAEPLVDREKAVLRSAPANGDVVDRLPSGQNLSISRESDDWLFVRYERDGTKYEGWAHRINIERDEP